MQVCNRCLADIDGKQSGAVMHHHDVDRELASNGGVYKSAELCRRCYREFVKMFTAWVKAGQP